MNEFCRISVLQGKMTILKYSPLETNLPHFFFFTKIKKELEKCESVGFIR